MDHWSAVGSAEAEGRRHTAHVSTHAAEAAKIGLVPQSRPYNVGLLVLAVCAFLVHGRAAAQTAPGGAPSGRLALAWHRLFLLDGEVLATLGEYTRVDDTVILQVPVGDIGSAGAPETRAVSIAASSVDWPRTDAYRESMRRAQFEQAGGERAYAAFTEEVAATLRDVALLPDPLERIRRLEAARVRLAQWPATHHGYRADEIAQTLSVVDDLLHGMRAAAGQQTFSLSLTAGPAPAQPASPSLLPAPTLQDVVAQALGLAPRVSDPAERLMLLESAGALLARPSDLDPRWVRVHRKEVSRQIKKERSVTRAYEQLRGWMLDRTMRLMNSVDVRGLMRLREDVERRDARLSRQRPAEVASLLATLDTRLETARRQRLLLERWTEQRPALERYAAVVTRHVAAGSALQRSLEEIKALSGPEPSLLVQAEGQLAGSRADARLVAVPEHARPVQQLWLSAQQLAGRALQTRRAAVRSGELRQAWEASAAAAGALLLLQQLRADAPALARPPAPPRPNGL